MAVQAQIQRRYEKAVKRLNKSKQGVHMWLCTSASIIQVPHMAENERSLVVTAAEPVSQALIRRGNRR